MPLRNAFAKGRRWAECREGPSRDGRAGGRPEQVTFSVPCLNVYCLCHRERTSLRSFPR
jgi:hypothetical protein